MVCRCYSKPKNSHQVKGKLSGKLTEGIGCELATSIKFKKNIAVAGCWKFGRVLRVVSIFILKNNM